jgi:ribosomal-protein-alanine N-acetyltransferase
VLSLSHKGTIKLETERLLLRRFVIADANDVFENWANDAEVTKYLTWQPHKNSAVTRQRLSSWEQRYKNPTFYSWAIVPKDFGKVIGSISIIGLHEKNLRAEVVYCLSKAFWGQGIMTEALKKVIEFMFTEVNINRLQAKHYSDNIASGKVMLKVGMKYEGTLRQSAINNSGQLVDNKVYAILKEEYLQKENSF